MINFGNGEEGNVVAMSEEERKAKARERAKAWYHANKERAKAYREANKEKRRSQRKARHEANKEVENAQARERAKVWYHANKDKVRERTKVYNEANKEKVAAQRKAHRAKNKDVISARNKAYRRGNKEKVAVKQKAYREANKERVADYHKAYYIKNKERVDAYKKAWHQAHPEVAKTSRHKRRARMAEVAADPSPKIKSWIKDSPKVCAYCGAECKDDHHVDHIIPISKGGPHQTWNLAIACGHCNLSKGPKPPVEWLAEMYDDLQLAREIFHLATDGVLITHMD